MKITSHVVTTIALILWFAGLLGAIFYIASAPKKEWSAILMFAGVILFPALIGLSYYLKNWNYLFLSPKTFFLISTIVPLLVFVTFFGNSIRLNLLGVSEQGITLKENSVYVNGTLLENADAKTFQKLEADYSKDGKRVFYFSRWVEGVDAASFSQIGESQYFRDNKHIIFKGKIIEGVDYDSFKVIGVINGSDKNQEYFYGKLAKK